MRAVLSTCSALLLAVVAGCGESSPPVDGGLPPGTDGGPPPVDAGPPPPPSGFVDPMCTDGAYRESPLPDPSASLEGITWSGDNVAEVADAALMRRYPFGLFLVEGGRTNPSFGDCSELFAGSPSSAEDVFRQLDTIVHECGHLYDGTLGGFSDDGYAIRTGLTLSCMRGDADDRGGDTFARSRIRGDEFQAMRPPCRGGSGCDFYADVYLDGDPDDASFQGGDQGFNMVLEETVQYVNSLATAYAFQDQLGGGSATSARDGILTFLWYVERYLHMARLMYPDAYARLSADACWRDAILTVWGRAWLYLELTRGMGSLGIDDDALETLVSDPILLDEIDRLRTLSGCP